MVLENVFHFNFLKTMEHVKEQAPWKNQTKSDPGKKKKKKKINK